MKPVTPFDNYPSFANGGSKSAPGDAKYALGFVAADTFPAEWANYFFHGATKGVSDLNTAVRSIWLELQNILTAYGISADISEESQLLSAIGKIYPRMTSCSTAAATEVKSLAITGEVLKPGNVYVIDMTNGNSYGDGISTYPKISINSGTSYPICDANGNYLASGAWSAGDTIKVLFTGSKYLMATRAVTDSITQGDMSPVTSNAVFRTIHRANTWENVTSIWVASAKSGFNNTNFNYKVEKRYNIDDTYTYRITALSPSVSESTAYIRFSQLPRTVMGFTTEGSSQSSDGTVISAITGFANTRDSRGSSNVSINFAFFSDRLELQFTSYASDRANQGYCTWELTVNKDLDSYFTV